MSTLMNRRTFFIPWLVVPAFLLAGAAIRAQNSGVASRAGMPGMGAMPEPQPGSHMVMTRLAPPQPGDRARAAAIVREVQAAIEKYKDYHVALASGFEMFAPQFPGKEKHFVNWRYAAEAQTRFNPSRPTALLYDRTPDGGWKLVGAMFTAPRWYSLAQLNQRVPLSVARWHRHINFCFPPPAEMRQIRQELDSHGLIDRQARRQFLNFYGISDEPACEQAGGHWVPQLYGWMVHVYPYDSNPWHMDPRMETVIER